MSIPVFYKGDRVRFAGGALHDSSPGYYPRPGSVGVWQGGGWVQWPRGTTSGDDRWHAPDSALEPAGEDSVSARREIVITEIDGGAEATLYDGGTAIRTVAVGSGMDKPHTGSGFKAAARRALDRLLPGALHRAGNSAFTYPSVAKETFVPHLEMHGEKIGVLGTPTKFKDVLGRPLDVGDVVEIFNRSSVSYGDNVLCDDGCQYVMGIKSSCDDRTGATGYWKLLRKRGFADVNNGERVDGVVYVKKPGGTCR